ncbi:hydrolase, partial [Oleiphilus sp. HI0130]
MDSLTQVALGAAVGHTMLGRKIGKLAPIWGAAIGTLPDLDVFISFGGVVEDFTYHRSFSHSLIVQLFLVPLLTWLALKLHPSTRPYKTRWALTILAILWTHSLLDTFTVYGTQLLWPLSEYPFGLSSVFIIDPAYTLPLLTGLGIAAYLGWQSPRARSVSVAALLISSTYLSWSLVAKATMKETIAKSLVEQNLNVYAVLTTPMPFNTLIWRIVALSDNEYFVAHVAVWEDAQSVEFRRYPKGEDLLSSIGDQWNVQRLQWFTKGFYRVAIRDNKIVMTDLRMGLEGSYVFNFAVGEKQSLESNQVLPVLASRVEEARDLSRVPLLWNRMFDPN